MSRPGLRHVACALMCAWLASSAAAAETAPAEERRFSVGAWVELSADGRAERVTLPEDTGLPAVLHAPVIEKVGNMAFEPAQVDGVPKPSRSWLQATLKLVPSGENYVLEIEQPALGPRPVNRFLPKDGLTPDQPVRALVTFGVTPDGRTENVEVVLLDQPGRGSRLAANLREAARKMGFEPEQVDGRPIAATLRWPFQVRRSTDPEKPFDLPPVARDPLRPGAAGQDAYSPPVVFTAVRRGEIFGTVPTH